VEHHGSYALALTRHFGNLDLPGPLERDVIYFTLPGHWLVIYPGSWAMPLAISAALGFVVVLIAGLRTGHATIAGIAAGMGMFLFALVGTLTVVQAAWWVLRFQLPREALLRHDIAILCGLALVASVVLMVTYGPVWRRIAIIDLHLGALVWWLALAIVTTVWLPGGSYLFVWPLVFGLLGIATTMLAGRESVIARVAPYLAAIPVLLIMPPTLEGLFHALSLQMPLLLMAVVVLTLGAILPLVRQVAAPGGGKNSPRFVEGATLTEEDMPV
jgi:hypothetical protein